MADVSDTDTTASPSSQAASESPALVEVRRQFVKNWGGLAGAFGMQRDLGRIHALVFISLEPIDAATIAAELGMNLEQCEACLDELRDWGVIDVAGSHLTGRRYVTERDPWAWFLPIVRERHRREFIPVLEAMRQTLTEAKALGSSDARVGESRRRIERFTKFVEDLSSLIELFVRIGSRPMAAVLKTIAKIAPRS